MAEREKSGEQLVRVQKHLARWRARHGGRGRPIPAALWAAAAEVATTEGVEATARALDVDRARLLRRMNGAPPPRSVVVRKAPLPATAGFVEVDAARVFSRGQMLVRLTNRDGEQLEIALEGGAADVATVARAFWRRGQ
jgi:hypothetical protein